MTPSSLEVTGQVQTHSRKPLVPPGAPASGLAYGSRQLSEKEMALEAIISPLGEALGEAAEGPGLPPAAISLCLRTAMGRSSLEYFPQGAERSTRPDACLSRSCPQGMDLVL